MIRYALRCHEGHAFDSWFRSAQDYETLRGGGHVACPDCGSAQVDKALMAPGVRPAPDTPAPAPPRSRAAALAELRRRVEAQCDYVGPRFAVEARRMRAGEAPERPIYGEARPEEARALLAEGVPVAPLPFVPTRKAN